jgi:hypothetical protein
MPMSNGARQEPSSSRAAPVDVEGLLDRWLERLERFPEREDGGASTEGSAPAKPGAATAPAAKSVAATAPPAQSEAATAPTAETQPAAPAGSAEHPLQAVEVRGELVRFAGDEMPYVIERADGRILHRGTIGVRGPGAVTAESYRSLGVADAERAAFEFVAHWFGAPFDAVNARTERALSWGSWIFTGPALAQALLQFKARSPFAFEQFLGKLGIDAVEDGAPLLAVRSARGTLLRGTTAEQVVTSDPRRVAALARAARDPDARAAQVATAFERSLRPALARPVPARSDVDPASRRLGEIATSARDLAVVFFAALRGQRAVSLLAQSVAQGWESGVKSWLSAVEGSGHQQIAFQARRILVAPELGMT